LLGVDTLDILSTVSVAVVVAGDINIRMGRPTDSAAVHIEMHDEIFHFEIFKNFMEILKHFKTAF